MFNFEHKEYLLLLCILPLLLGIYIVYQYWRKNNIKKVGNPESDCHINAKLFEIQK